MGAEWGQKYQVAMLDTLGCHYVKQGPSEGQSVQAPNEGHQNEAARSSGDDPPSGDRVSKSISP